MAAPAALTVLTRASAMRHRRLGALVTLVLLTGVLNKMWERGDASRAFLEQQKQRASDDVQPCMVLYLGAALVRGISAVVGLQILARFSDQACSMADEVMKSFSQAVVYQLGDLLQPPPPVAASEEVLEATLTPEAPVLFISMLSLVGKAVAAVLLLCLLRAALLRANLMTGWSSSCPSSYSLGVPEISTSSMPLRQRSASAPAMLDMLGVDDSPSGSPRVTLTAFASAPSLRHAATFSTARFARPF
eukprot:TRINITY_DN93987_c0_g1_i1.p1 TRINITY_DN93987_c0_g1~~TRINITY_DN93987_c0_g1_i1.p1  ORF type:complete len:247 (+),score=36.48 TRINITY_DN93987_c0_g1_i1:34-774(+)